MGKFPEFRKQLWLNFTTKNIVILSVIALMVYIIAMINGGNNPYDPLAIERAISSASTILIFGYLFLLGSIQVTQSINNELNNGTWHLLRLSRIEPWGLAIGKYLGSQILHIGFSLIFGVIYLFSRTAIDGFAVSLQNLLTIYFFGFAVTTLSFFVSSLNVDKTGETNLVKANSGKAVNTTPAGVGVIVLMVFSSLYTSIISGEFSDKIMHWFGIELTALSFIDILSIYFGGWLLYGSVRFLRSALYTRTNSFAWPSFLITYFVVVLGVLWNAFDTTSLEINNLLNTILLIFAFIMTFTLVGLLYLTLLGENKTLSHMKRLKYAIQSFKLKKITKLLPTWAWTYIYLILSTIFLMIMNRITTMSKSEIFFTHDANGNFATNITLILSWFFFVTRDFFAILALSISPWKKSTDKNLLLYLFVFNPLLIILLSTIGSTPFSQFFFPFGENFTIGNSAVFLFEAGIAILLFLNQYSKLKISK